MKIDNILLVKLTAQAKESPGLRSIMMKRECDSGDEGWGVWADWSGWHDGEDGMSSKQEKAMALKDTGQDIEIMSEEQFLSMLGVELQN